MTLDEPTASIFAAALALVGVLIGLGGSQVIAALQRRQKSDELLLKAMDFLGGGTQERNLGIAAIRLYLEDKRHQDICMSLLIGAAIYLLLGQKREESKSGQEEEQRPHEQYNLARIMDLVLVQQRVNEKTLPQYEELSKALVRAREPGRISGLPVEMEQLKDGQSRLQGMLDAFRSSERSPAKV